MARARNSARGTVTVRNAKGPMATGRKASGSFLVARWIVARERNSAIARIGAQRSRGRSATQVRAIHARRAMAHGNSTNRASTVRVTEATNVRASRVRATTIRTVAHGASTSQNSIVRVATVPNSIVRGKIARTARSSAARAKPDRIHDRRLGRNIRAANAATIGFLIGRGAITRTTARFSPSGRRSVAVGPIASARSIPTSGCRGRSRARRKPASASPS